DVALSGEENYRDRLRLFPQSRQKFHAVHARHFEVRQHDSRRPRRNLVQSFQSVLCGFGAITPGRNQLSQSCSFIFFVLYNEDLFLLTQMQTPSSKTTTIKTLETKSSLEGAICKKVYTI